MDNCSNKNTYEPLVSVICMCFNHGDYVVESLESIKNQSYANIEILINDDLSSDNSVSVIKNWLKDNDVAYVNFSQENIGNTKSFNNSVKHAKGDYLIDLAADDILFPKAVENHISNFRKHDFEKGVSFGNAEYVDINDKHLGFHFPVDRNHKVIEQPISGDIYKIMLQKYYINSCTMMICNRLFQELDGYDEDLWYEDLDFILRASRKHPFYFSDSILIKKREIASSLGNQFRTNFNRQTKKLENSTHKIFKKAYSLNKLKQEDLALMERVGREIKLNFKNSSFIMLIKNLILLIKLRLK